MDRNSVTGFVLIALILIGYTYFTSPSQEEMDKIQLQRDSIAQVEDQKRIEREKQEITNQLLTELLGWRKSNKVALPPNAVMDF